MREISKKFKKNFLSRFPITASMPEYENECWPWMGPPGNKGYGKVRLGNKIIEAHRISYALFNGPIEYKQVVRHTCDNPICVNPKHLILGTYSDNTLDVVKQNLWHRSKLTVNDIKYIKWALKYYPISDIHRKLAAKFKVDKSIISKIKHNKIWTFVKTPEEAFYHAKDRYAL
jgi:hypothetical protein